MSNRGSKILRMVGKHQAKTLEIKIDSRPKHGEVNPPILPSRMDEVFHYGGNSLCYAIQLAHRMGARRIIAVGFTLQDGGRYAFEGRNPATNRQTTFYGDWQRRMALDYLQWYQLKFPNRALLDPSFDGPVYDVLEKASYETLQGQGQEGP